MPRALAEQARFQYAVHYALRRDAINAHPQQH
ncbi:MAG: hypothetical protein BWY25_01999 [Chloroflexi bacterium ADurb.Bin222]|nr:MAG: hypothetical protein BWY25_01999 [Chloroflexi bacterium ADurb.Bin222]